MEICNSCTCFKACKNSGYDLDFIRRMMIASSIVSYKTVYVTHLDDARMLGYDLNTVLEFVNKNRESCFFFSSDNLSSTKKIKEELAS